MNILIVDPDIGIIKHYQETLSGEGDYKLSFEQSAQAALKMLQTSPPDLVITEHKLIDMDIFDFLRAVLHENIPAIIVSSEASERLIVECIRMGASDYLSKSKFKLGFLKPIIKRASMEFPHFKAARFVETMVSKTPGYSEVNEQVHEFLLVEKKEQAKKMALALESNPNKRVLAEGMVYSFIHLYVKLHIPPNLVKNIGSQNVASLKNQISSKFIAIPANYGGELWNAQEDVVVFSFGPEEIMPALTAALDIFGHTFIQNVTLGTGSDDIQTSLCLAEGQTLYHDDKSKIISGAISFCAQLISRDSSRNNIVISGDIREKLTDRANKYFEEIEPFQEQSVYRYSPAVA